MAGYEEKSGDGVVSADQVSADQGDAKSTASGPVADTKPDNADGTLNPSAPGETGTTPGTNEVRVAS